MKTTFVKGFALLAMLSIVICCKNKAAESEDGEISAEASSTQITSNAALQNNKSDRKFVRTADAKFEVQNVHQATYAIENATTRFGGFVTYTNLQSHVFDKQETKISQDSIVETFKYKVENSVTIRVPNTQLDTVLRTIGKQIKFLDYRVIKADDVSLQMLADQMASRRNIASEKRLEKAIDNKGTKLKTIIDAEDRLDLKKSATDVNTISTLALKDQVYFSTVTLEIYQKETVRNEVVANESNIDAYRPHIGLRIIDGLKTGWYILEGIIAFIVQLWSIALILLLGVIIYRKYTTKPHLK